LKAMQNSDRGKSYRTLLLERQGKSFSEFEVTEMLRQVLPQLAEIHLRGQAHGAVFLDNLVYDLADNRALLVVAIAPEKQQLAQASISKDIYALGVAAIALLTAKPLNLLRHPDGSWNWEENCTVSDQLAAVINRTIADPSPNSFASANEVLSALNFSPAQYGYADTAQVLPAIDQNPAGFYVPATALSFDSNESQKPQPKLLVWQWISIGLGVTLLAGLAGFGIVKKLNDRSEVSTTSEVTPQSQSSPFESSPESRSPPPPTSSPTSVDTERVSFASGSTGSTIRGNISPAQIRRYLVNSGEGQQFSVRILQGNVNVAVIDPSGRTLGTATSSSTFWQGRLPRTGDYAVEITSENNSTYAVSVEVLAAAAPPANSDSLAAFRPVNSLF
jgi:serine/threonine-protein kinase